MLHSQVGICSSFLIDVETHKSTDSSRVVLSSLPTGREMCVTREAPHDNPSSWDAASQGPRDHGWRDPNTASANRSPTETAHQSREQSHEKASAERHYVVVLQIAYLCLFLLYSQLVNLFN